MRETMLVVEDEAPCRRALQRLLEARGFTVRAVASAEEALEVLVSARPKPGVMVVDVDLPGMCGLDLVERVQELMPKVHPVLVTAADRSRVSAFAVSHEVDYFAKPLDVPGFLARIRCVA